MVGGLSCLMLLVPTLARSAPCDPQSASNTGVLVSWPLGDIDNDGVEDYDLANAIIYTESYQGSPDYGTYTIHRAAAFDFVNMVVVQCNTPKRNCEGNSYSYAAIQIDAGWQATVMFPEVGSKTVGRADNERYWRNYYKGYTETGNADYSQNCHGYSLGVGDWAGGGVDPMYGQLDHVLVPGYCWVSCAPNEVEVGVTSDHGHSMKMQAQLCQIQETMHYAVVNTSEKFRESQYFSQSAPCVPGVNPLKAHPNYGSIIMFKRVQ
jgi:hypothetical protein